MAKLHEISDSEGDSLDTSTMLYPAIRDQREPSSSHDARQGSKKEYEVGASTKGAQIDLEDRPQSTDVMPLSVKKATSKEQQARKQRSIRLTHNDSLSFPILAKSIQIKEEILGLPTLGEINAPGKTSPRRVLKYKFDDSLILSNLQDALQSREQDDFHDGLSNFIVDDSASGSYIRPPRSVVKNQKRLPKKHLKKPEYRGSSPKPTFSKPKQLPIVIDLTSPLKKSRLVPDADFLPTERSLLPESPGPRDTFNDDADAHLRFSPSGLMSPTKHAEGVCFVTPPQSPSKPRLQSPSKSQRIPPSPQRPSLDGFWSQEVTNDWNDQYSPQKIPRSRGLFSLDEDNQADHSSSTSPRKSPIKTPARKDKQALAAKKLFNAQKHSLATSFLQDLDRTISNFQVSALASSTGGIHIVWSKKLSSTAGRANWKREAIRSKPSVGTATATAPTTTYRHHASIELAEKVIDDADRLLNVLAHEYCHLANFMLSHCTTAPHGASFKSWARKVSTAFAHRNVAVTTKHSYTIEYKYIWACEACGVEYKRHSKSIEPGRHRCGSCKGALVQMVPKPRAGPGEAEGNGSGGGFQRYVKENYKRVKGEMEMDQARVGKGGIGMGEVMGVLGREWRERKGAGTGKGTEAVLSVVEAPEEEGEVEDAGLEDVARKLNFLDLSAED